ncbi:MAG: IclR family transcriptional regulator [Anaerolineae bacterium]|jgi:DNA-binding IclR family transcriptional regulator|nr:IclR family transcriptional regulator [Anaerolineae bacterium]
MIKEEHAPVSRTIARAVAILEAFDGSQSTLGITEISQRTGLDKSTVHRLLQALQQGGLIARDTDSARYCLGLGLLRLASRASQRLDLPRMARPVLEALALRSQETVTLTVLDAEDRAVLVDVMCSTHYIRDVALVGRDLPLHATAAGKILLASLSGPRLERVLSASLPQFTERTLTNVGALREAVETLRGTGYALAEEELEHGLSDIAAPVLNHQGLVIAALGVSGPSFRLSHDVLKALAPEVVRAAAHISILIGYSP